MSVLDIVLLSILGAVVVGAIVYFVARRWDAGALLTAVNLAANRQPGGDRLVVSATPGMFSFRAEPANATPVIPQPAPAPQWPPAQPGMAWVPVQVQAAPVTLTPQASSAQPANPAPIVTVAPVITVGGVPVPTQTQAQAQGGTTP